MRHEFTLTNPTNRPIRVLKAEALNPCGSAVGSVPEAVPPLGEAKLPVVFRPGYQSGRKQVLFAVWTDDSAEPVKIFALVASLTSEVETSMLEGSDASLRLGQSGRQTIRVVCRRMGNEGRGAPDAVTASAPVAARFAGPPSVRRLPDGTVEATRDIEVTLSAECSTGLRQTELVLHWADGTIFPHTVVWRVRPCIVAVPAGVVLKASAGRVERTILLNSLDRPFCILAVRGSALAGEWTPLVGSRSSHLLRMALDADRASGEGTSDLVITTDHPDQPTVSVSVLVLPTAEASK